MFCTHYLLAFNCRFFLPDFFQFALETVVTAQSLSSYRGIGELTAAKTTTQDEQKV